MTVVLKLRLRKAVLMPQLKKVVLMRVYWKSQSKSRGWNISFYFSKFSFGA